MLACVFGAATLAAVLYPLSLGPVEWLHNRGYLNWAEPVWAYYVRPHVWISEHIPLLGEIVGWYIDL